MNDDLTQEILFGTPDMTVEEEQQMQLQAEQSAQDMAIMESMARQQAMQEAAAAQQPQGSTQQSAQPTGQAQQQQETQGGDQNIIQQAFDVLSAIFCNIQPLDTVLILIFIIKMWIFF